MTIEPKTKVNTKPITMKTNQNIIPSIIINGDISRLPPQQKVTYYKEFCERLGSHDAAIQDTPPQRQTNIVL